MNLYKINISYFENISNPVNFEYSSVCETNSLVDINRYLSKSGYPLFCGNDMNRLRDKGNSIMYQNASHDTTPYYIYMIDINHPQNDFYYKRIIRDQKIKNILNETK